MRVDELADGGIDGRPRAQELSSSLRVVPFIDHTFKEWHGFAEELANFLSIADFSLENTTINPNGSALQRAKYLLQDRNVQSRLPIEVNFETEDPEEVLLIFIQVSHIKCKDSELSKLIRNIAEYRWSDLDGPMVGLLFSALAAALYTTNGPTPSGYSVSPSPTDYEAFRQNVTMRYPCANPPVSDLPLSAHTAFDLPKRLMQPILGVSTMPKSIEEACEIFKSRVQTTTEFTQFWQQHEALARVKAGRHPELIAQESLYALTLPFAKSFYTVFVNYVLKRGMTHEEPAGVRFALGAIFSLITSCTHVLEKQFILTVLFDLQLHLVAFKISALNPVLDTVVQPNPQPTWIPPSWERRKSNGSHLNHKRSHSTSSATDGICIEQFSSVALETLILLMRIVRLSITDRPQRIAIVAELPAAPLKQLMSMYNDDLWSEVLLIFKLQASLNGKKWRCMNMEIISAIYIHCPFKLDDDWLTGGDAINEVRPPAIPEETLRELIELYNATHKRH